MAPAVQSAEREFGRFDYGFNVAGIHVPATDIAGEEATYFDRINLRGTWACMKHELVAIRRHRDP